jgi:cysteine-rich repeat protein
VANAPPSTARCTEVSMRESIACAIKADHTIKCWGTPDPGGGTLNSAPGTHVHELAVGFGHGCALRDSDNRLTCWGLPADWNKYTDVPYKRLASDRDGICGITMTGSIACAGGNASSQVTSAPATGEYTQISGGNSHYCALRSDGAAVCWGANPYGNAPTTPLAGPYVQVAAGQTNSCGLKADGKMDCWGAGQTNQGTLPNFGQSVAPSTPADIFSEVSAGYSFACGIRKFGGAECWGLNDHNQSSPLPRTCGDGVIQIGEACDDGNVVDGDGCSADCMSTEVCGNGIVDTNANPPEQCDGNRAAQCLACRITITP